MFSCKNKENITFFLLKKKHIKNILSRSMFLIDFLSILTFSAHEKIFHENTSRIDTGHSRYNATRHNVTRYNIE